LAGVARQHDETMRQYSATHEYPEFFFNNSRRTTLAGSGLLFIEVTKRAWSASKSRVSEEVLKEKSAHDRVRFQAFYFMAFR
jgi:hypothetical protein